MQVILYDQLDPSGIPNFAKTKRALEAGDFRSADVKKVGPNLYRARLDRSDRLLFSLYRFQGRTHVLVLEHIARHAYDKSRFLRRGVGLDESKLPALNGVEEADAEPLIYLNPQLPTFHVLNKVISFDDAQQAVFATPPPFIVIGSAGSGKTALTLEKVKQARGDVLYVTRSPYLVRNSRDVYYALAYQNEDQDVSFLSFAEYLASLRVPQGREVRFRDFARWFAGHRVSSKLTDPHQVYEEFQGVITGALPDRAYLSLEDYLGLGVKQSIFQPHERERVYALFGKYRAFLGDNDLFDANILSFEYLPLVEPRYDFVVVDEVQDMTTVQLDVVLRSLSIPGQFILCGDANQIVHPNFFSWSKLKSFFREDGGLAGQAGHIRILTGKYGVETRPERGRIVDTDKYARRYGETWYYRTAQSFVEHAAARGIHPATLAVAWVMSHPAVTAPIVGARNVEQLEASLGASEIDLTPAWRDEITALSVDPPPATDRNEDRVRPAGP